MMAGLHEHARGRSGGQALLADWHVTVAEESKSNLAGSLSSTFGEENRIKVRVGAQMLVIEGEGSIEWQNLDMAVGTAAWMGS